MVNLDSARKAARAALESTYYEGLCTIIEYGDITDAATKITRQGEQTIVENQPCKLSFESQNATSQTETGNSVTQSIKLFLAPEIPVKSGSKVVIEQHGKTHIYASSGEPAIYPTHQEITLELFKGWA